MGLITPMDYLNYFKGKNIDVHTKHRGIVTGILQGFDLNTNLGIEVDGALDFIKGENVTLICLHSE